MKCYLCSDELTEANKSAEHIIANCIGGWIKPKDLLCVVCNGRTKVYEDELKDFGATVMNFYNIKRDRGGFHGPVEVLYEDTGKGVMLWPGGTITHNDPVIQVNEETGELTITAYNEERADQELARFIKQQESDGNQVDLTKMKKQNNFITEDKGPLIQGLHTGNFMVEKAVLKMILNFYLYKGGERKYIRYAIEYIGNIYENDYRFCQCYIKNISKSHFDGNPFHIIIIKNDRKEVKAYFELFGRIGYIAVISNDYNGEDFQWNYAFDTKEHKVLQFDYSFAEKVHDIFNFFSTSNNGTTNFGMDVEMR